MHILFYFYPSSVSFFLFSSLISPPPLLFSLRIHPFCGRYEEIEGSSGIYSNYLGNMFYERSSEELLAYRAAVLAFSCYYYQLSIPLPIILKAKSTIFTIYTILNINLLFYEHQSTTPRRCIRVHPVGVLPISTGLMAMGSATRRQTHHCQSRLLSRVLRAARSEGLEGA